MPAVEIVDAIRSHRLPSITIRPDNDVINIYTQSFGKGDTVRQIYLTTKVNGYWVASHKPYGNSGISTNQLTIGWGLGGQYAAIPHLVSTAPLTHLHLTHGTLEKVCRKECILDTNCNIFK